MPTRASRAVVVVVGARAGGDRRRRGRGAGAAAARKNQRARDRVAIDDAGAWRVYDVHVSVDDDLGKDSSEASPAVLAAVQKILGTARAPAASGTRVRRKTCDARTKPPGFSYVVDVSDEAI